MSQPAKYLITGASGLLGSALLQELHEYELFLYGRRPPKHLTTPLPQNCHWIDHDLTEPNFTQFLPPQIDGIIHLAQSRRFKEFPEAALDIINVNTSSTIQLLDYARKAKARTLIYASSGAVYGTNPSRVCLESTPLTLQKNQGLYCASKIASEMFVESFSNFLTTVILRFFFIYGPGQNENMLIPRLVQSVKENRAIVIQGTDGLHVNPIYVTDAAKAVKVALNLNRGATINIAGPEVLSMREIGETIGRRLNKDVLFETRPQIGSDRLVGDINRMQTMLVSPKIVFSEGISNSILTNLQGHH